MAVIYSLVLVGLDNIQDSLENPYDGMSQDDIRFDQPATLLTRTIVDVGAGG
jgi:predicted membrane chloride channel (bestrophin family)